MPDRDWLPGRDLLHRVETKSHTSPNSLLEISTRARIMRSSGLWGLELSL